MKRILVSSFDMEVGGVERSLASLLEHFDYDEYEVDLMLYRHQGEFMSLLPREANLLEEQPAYTTFRKSIGQIFREGQPALGIARTAAKLHADVLGKLKGITEPGYYQMQLMWKYALPFLPRMEEEYDCAVSYLWPHYYIAEKVKAKKKVAWIHTDYSTVHTNRKMDLSMWSKFDHIIAVSDACRSSFLAKYPTLDNKVLVIENITSPAFIRAKAGDRQENAKNPMMKDSRFKLITVARLSSAKGIDQAILAMRLLKDRGHDQLAWYVVGYGGDEAMLRQLITEHQLEDSFILLGKKMNPYPYIQAGDLYVQPSRYEGKAVTVTEAQILGKPVLITNYTTAASQVNDQIDGVITPMSPKGIADGIERMIRDELLRNRVAMHCKRTNYSNSSELDKLYQLI